MPETQETLVQFLGQEDPLKEMATHSSSLAGTSEEPGGRQHMASQRVRHDWRAHAHTHTRTEETLLNDWERPGAGTETRVTDSGYSSLSRPTE